MPSAEYIIQAGTSFLYFYSVALEADVKICSANGIFTFLL